MDFFLKWLWMLLVMIVLVSYFSVMWVLTVIYFFWPLLLLIAFIWVVIKYRKPSL